MQVTPWLLNSRFSESRSSRASSTQADSSTVGPATTTTTDNTTPSHSHTNRSSARSSVAFTVIARETIDADVSGLSVPDNSESPQEHELEDRVEDERQRDTVITVTDKNVEVALDDLPGRWSRSYRLLTGRPLKRPFVRLFYRLSLPVLLILLIVLSVLLILNLAKECQ